MSADIWSRRCALDKERREFLRKVMEEFDRDRAKKLEKLYEECEETTGHHWTFTHSGPLGDPWFVCATCGMSRVNAHD